MPAASWPRCCKREETEVGEPGDVAVGRADPEDAAHQAWASRSSSSSTPSRVVPPTTPSRLSGTPPSRSTTSGEQASTAWPPPSPNHARGSSGSASSAPRPEWIAASARQTASPPLETSWTNEHCGAARQRNSISDASAARSRRAGRPPTSSPAGLVLRAGERDGRGAGEQDHVSVAPALRHVAHVLEQPDAADDRSRVDRATVGLVVERDIAGHDRHAQRLASLRHPLDRLGELPGDLALLGVAEVEAIGQPDRLGAGAGNVAHRLEHGELPACAGPQATHTTLAVERDREPAVTGPQAEDGRVEAGPPHGPGADEVVVAPEDPFAAAEVRRAEQLEQGVPVVRRHGIRHRRRLGPRAAARSCSGGTRRSGAAPGSRRRPRRPRRRAADRCPSPRRRRRGEAPSVRRPRARRRASAAGRPPPSAPGSPRSSLPTAPSPPRAAARCRAGGRSPCRVPSPRAKTRDRRRRSPATTRRARTRRARRRPRSASCP